MKPGVFRLKLALVIAALSASSVRGEVRLEAGPRDEPSVEVIDTPAGPWTPTSGGSSVILNPDGDLIGDSQPGWSSRGSAALAAWVRPTTSTVELAVGQNDEWTALTAVDVTGAFRPPMVDPLDRVWTVTWQQSDPAGPRIYFSTTSDAGRVASPVFVAEGFLIGTVPARDALNVLVYRPETGELFWVFVQVTYVPTQPMPIELHPGDGLSQGGIRAPILLSSCGECREVRFHEDVEGRGAPLSALTWWSDPATLRAVEITAEGPVLPGISLPLLEGDPHPERLLDDALRLLERD